MRGKKTDSESIVKVITAKIKNPDASLRDIEKETWINHATAWDILKNETDEVLTSSSKKQELMNVNLWIITKWKALIESSIGVLPLERYSDLSQLSNIVETAFKQNELLDGWITERNETIIKWEA